ncbi:MAG TPA: maltose alpha-D-glucosyltransferase [Candidatus Binatia bacterium]|nr:maltose alpha-D-glucosyltransferase [Candidatus Binatia bacterium]
MADDSRAAPGPGRGRAQAGDPLWYKDAVIYQLHVKSFFDANNDGIGDFAGLIQKLDYLVELGVDTLWLLPFYPSPRLDDGYDIAYYAGVHPDYGTLQDARRFIKEAHKRKLRVITELVINHTSDQHKWFQRARRAKPGSSARNFYVWSDTPKKYDGTRIIFCDTEQSNWTWDEEAKAYYWHRFYSHQPDLNFDHPPVLKAVLGVMKFWLNLGVDGLRLDAVPYLIEREGTNNENLPETHAILKQIRAALDGSFQDRMLLAEANQWPEDAQEYFGAGDECHMAFHFPLMPRMYMAIAREDRFPITDIMRQTPDIPPNCQWAIFLRNHDELTLEMVTDAERDYLWTTYASDRRARINLGIRRRLAPLLERDRRRIELMNSLLLSMPGTPVIYYGDEIGMGDNVHLRDRDGVRTPMQWTPDRNGGFSRADPEQLVLPALQGPLYGFEAVNVEAQSRDPHSLLNWMRHMLAVRKRHHAFGRGTIRFLHPQNRKVLAFLRETGDEKFLCVANLSRASQAVELELAEFAGQVPVELTGGATFPPIGQLSYLLTLPPYGFYWFNLCTEAQLPTWRTEPPEQMPEFHTLVLRNGLAEIPAEGKHLRVLEGDALPRYLPKRRWFASKDQKLAGARLAYAVPLPGSDALLAEVDVRVGERGERYALPLAIAWEDPQLPALPQQLALARVRQGRRVGYLTDAFSLKPFGRALLDLLREGATVETPQGALKFLPTRQIAGLKAGAGAEVRWLSTEQSNSSLVLNEETVLKLVRHLQPGVHPEAEVTRYLTEAGYANVAPMYGEVVRVTADGVPHTLAIVQGYLNNQGDAWNWTLEYLRRTVEDLAVTGEGGAGRDDALAGYERFAAVIGRRLGELHAMLARPTGDAAFAPERAGAAEFRAWTGDTTRLLGEVLDLLAARKEWPDPATRARAARLVERREALLDAAAGLRPAGLALATRIHGDFHLGQVLVVKDDAYLLDFEGEPGRTLDERRRKTSPLRDVAGLLRSFDYAVATVGALDPEHLSEPAQKRRDELLARFSDRASSAFLRAYREVAAAAPQPWTDAESERVMLDLFLLEKAAYEVRYEAANRPHWLGVPVRGLAELAERLAPEAAHA